MTISRVGSGRCRFTGALRVTLGMVLTVCTDGAAQRIDVVPPADTAIVRLDRGRDTMVVLKVRMTAADTLAVEKAWSRYQTTGDPVPDGTPEVRVVGLVNANLRKDQDIEISLIFPAYRRTATYASALFFKKKGGPEEGERFYAFRIAVQEPAGALLAQGRTLAALIAIVLAAVLLVAAIVVRGAEKKRNFFQSPDGTYSVSRFQVWLWTMVVLFSFTYLFLTQGPNIPFPESIWGLLGISLGSISAATALAIQKEKPEVAAAGPAPAPGAALPAAVPAALPAAQLQPADKPASKNPIRNMLSEEGNPSIMRLQMFAWTFATAVFFVIQVFTTGMLWDVPSSLLVLMGISHTSYLVDKGIKK